VYCSVGGAGSDRDRGAHPGALKWPHFGLPSRKIPQAQ
jgi:hypothetical protein